MRTTRRSFNQMLIPSVLQLGMSMMLESKCFPEVEEMAASEPSDTGQSESQVNPYSKGESTAAKQFDTTFHQYRFRDGKVLDDVRIHYATLGTPHRNANGQIDNAILLLHWTGSQGGAFLAPNFMRTLFGPGCPLDPARFFLIFPDSIGCGKSSKPSDGMKASFPRYGYSDMVVLQHKLVTEVLKIERLKAIIGLSMGGMNAWQWAGDYPDAMEALMPVVSLPIKVSGRNLVWRKLAASIIRSDPSWSDGNYTAQPQGGVQGYSILRMMIDGVEHMQVEVPDSAGADTFLSAAAKEAQAGDTNDLLYSLESSSDYDPQPKLKDIRARVHALNFDDDEFNPDRLQILEKVVPTIPNAQYRVQPGGPKSFGHLTMAHPELWSQHVVDFVNSLS